MRKSRARHDTVGERGALPPPEEIKLGERARVEQAFQPLARGQLVLGVLPPRREVIALGGGLACLPQTSCPFAGRGGRGGRRRKWLLGGQRLGGHAGRTLTGRPP